MFRIRQQGWDWQQQVCVAHRNLDGLGGQAADTLAQTHLLGMVLAPLLCRSPRARHRLLIWYLQGINQKHAKCLRLGERAKRHECAASSGVCSTETHTAARHCFKGQGLQHHSSSIAASPSAAATARISRLDNASSRSPTVAFLASPL